MFIIYDENNEGYAYNSPLEGWIFSTLPNMATTFKTKQAAQEAVRLHYIQDKKQYYVNRTKLVIKEIKTAS